MALATVSVLMAAKLSQPISPSFNRMIGELPKEFKGSVTKPELIELEFDVVSTL